MGLLQPGHVGILPVGALGVAFFHHLTDGCRRIDGRVHFLEREGSASSSLLRKTGTLRIDDTLHDLTRVWSPDLPACLAAGHLPEIVLICTQPDQLLGMMKSIVRLLERLHTAGALDQLPLFILLSNGIYYQRVRQYFGEVLEEAMMFGRLPDLWENGRMGWIIGRLLRGVTIQTGQREGDGADAIYRPGPSGRTRIAGGDPAHRERAARVLTGLGAWFEVAAHPSATRVEFDKALVNLFANLLGQLHAIDEAGNFRLLTIRQIIDAAGTTETRELARHVIAVGQAVRAYEAGEDFEALLAEMLASARQHLDHVPSSLQWIAQRLRARELPPRRTPTEQWLLDPLIRYAQGAGLDDTAQYFEDLTHRIEHRLALAAGRP